MIIICISGGDDRDPLKTSVRASSAAILARILVLNTVYLAQLTADQSLLPLLQQAGVPIEENILLCLVDIWVDKVSKRCSCLYDEISYYEVLLITSIYFSCRFQTFPFGIFCHPSSLVNFPP